MILYCNTILCFSCLSLRSAASLSIFSLICLGFLPLFLPNFLPIFPVAINFFFEMLPGFLPLFFFTTTSSLYSTSIATLFNSGGITINYICYGSESLAAVVPLTFLSINKEGFWTSICCLNFFCSRLFLSSCFLLISISRFRNKSSSCCIFLASRSKIKGLFYWRRPSESELVSLSLEPSSPSESLLSDDMLARL